MFQKEDIRMNQDIQKFINSVTDDEKEGFLQFLKERADAGKSAEEALGEYAAVKGYNLSEDDLRKMPGMTMLSAEDLKEVSAGTAFTAGTPSQNALWDCPTDHRNAYRTGREEERNFFIFWSRHMKEYHCPDCNHDFWVHED